MISSLSSSSITGSFGVELNHNQAKNHPPPNSSAFRAVFGVATFFTFSHGNHSATFTFHDVESFPFFSKSFLIFTKFASETIFTDDNSFHITFSKYLEKVCLETHNSLITSSIRGISNIRIYINTIFQNTKNSSNLIYVYLFPFQVKMDFVILIF
jgi:hypothetical protein